MCDWKPISELPQKYFESRSMFVVRALFEDLNYMTDPYCVWRNDDGSFNRWPHDRPPTMFLELPK